MPDCYVVDGNAVKKKYKVKKLLERIKELEERVVVLEAKQTWPYFGTWWVGDPICQPPRDETVTITWAANHTGVSADWAA